jgi:hypothetical protein
MIVVLPHAAFCEQHGNGANREALGIEARFSFLMNIGNVTTAKPAEPA